MPSPVPAPHRSPRDRDVTPRAAERTRRWQRLPWLWAVLALATVGGVGGWGAVHWQQLRLAQAQRDVVQRAEQQQRDQVLHWLRLATEGRDAGPAADGAGAAGALASPVAAPAPSARLATGLNPFPDAATALAALSPMLARAPDDPLLQATTAAVLGLLAEQALFATAGEAAAPGPLKRLPLGDAASAPSGAAPPAAATAEGDAPPAELLERAVALGEQAWPRLHAAHPAWALRHLRHLRLSAWLLHRAGRLGAAVGRLEQASAHLQDDGPAPLGDDPSWQVAGRAERAALALTSLRWSLDAYRLGASARHASAAESLLQRLKAASAQWPTLAAVHSFDWPDGLAAGAPEAEIDHRLAQIHLALAEVADRQDDLVAMGREAEAAAALHQALAGAALDADRPRWRQALANDRQWLALARLRQGDPASALTLCDQAWAMAASAGAPPAVDGRAAIDLPRLAVTRGRALAALDRHDEALDAFEWALGAWSARLARGDDPVLRLHIARLQAWRAISLRAEGESVTALPLLGTAVAALRGLASAGDPKTVDLHREALLALAEAAAHLAQMDPAEAPVLKPEAAAALREAASLQRLGEDHQRLLGALGLPLPASQGG